MRRSFGVLAVLLVLSGVLIAAAHLEVSRAEDAVSLEETVLAGDRTVAVGVTLDCRTECLHHLFWDTRCVLGETPAVHTDYTFTREPRTEYVPLEPSGVQLDFYGNGSVTDSMAEVDRGGMEKPFNDVASRVPPGEERTETVRLRDYYEYFPLYPNVDFPGYAGGNWYSDDGNNDALRAVLSRWFRIPVPEDARMEITIGKYDNGDVSSSGWSWSENVGELLTDNVATENGCYFTVCGSPWSEAAVEVGPSALEYGVYYLPFQKITEDGQTEPDTEGFGCVFPVDPSADWVRLFADADKSRLYLVTRQGTECLLTVVDEATRQPIQTLRLFDSMNADEGFLSNFFVYQDFLVPCLDGGRFAVVSIDGGAYELRFTGSFTDLNANSYYPDEAVMDFDGERLAVASFEDRWSRSSFYLAVYDSSGMAYLGRYAHSQDRGGSFSVYQNRCIPVGNRPLTVRLPA